MTDKAQGGPMEGGHSYSLGGDKGCELFAPAGAGHVVPRVTVVRERELAAAFTEWDRRYREEPERFMSEAVRLLKGDPKSYGDAAAPYLLAILAEQAKEDS